MRGLTLTTKEQTRIQVLNGVIEGKVTVAEASGLMGVSEPHAWRLLAAYRGEGPAAVAHGNRGRKPATTTCPQTREKVRELADATPVQERRGNRARAARLSQGRQATGQRQATSRGIFRWHPPETATAGRPSRPTASAVQERPQRAYQTARSGRMRDVRLNGGCRSSPHPRTSRPERERPTGKAQVGSNHGGAAAQDPRGLPDVSHGHPPRAHVIRKRNSR